MPLQQACRTGRPAVLKSLPWLTFVLISWPVTEQLCDMLLLVVLAGEPAKDEVQNVEADD